MRYIQKKTLRNYPLFNLPAILLQNIDTCLEVKMKSIPAFVGKVRHEEDALNCCVNISQRDVQVSVPSIGAEVSVDIAFGGMW